MNARLPEILTSNSFNILGLSSSASLKDVRKRTQQLLQLAKIEETEVFDNDIGHVHELRKEGAIRIALEKLSGVKERLTEVFFWFDEHDIESQKALKLISQGDYQETIKILIPPTLEVEDAAVSWLAYKNLALTLIFQAFNDSDLDSFEHALEMWKRIINSEDFWKFYKTYYLFHDELGTSLEFLEEFRSSIYAWLSEKAVFFYRHINSPRVISSYYSVFGQIEEAIDVKILQPIIFEIKKEIKTLSAIGVHLQACAIGDRLEATIAYVGSAPQGDVSSVSESAGTLICKEVQQELLKQSLTNIYQYFIEIDKFELFDYSPVMVLKDDSAEKIRSIFIDIYHRNNDVELALFFFEEGAKLAVSDVIVDKIKSNKNQLKENRLWETISIRFDKIKALMKEGRVEESRSGYLSLDHELKNCDDDAADGVRGTLLINFCSQLIEKGGELFDKKMFGIQILAIQGLLNWKNHRDAIRAVEYACELFKDRLYLFVFTNSSHDRVRLLKIIDNILSNSLRITEVDSLSNYHRDQLKIMDEISNSQENDRTQEAITLFGIAACYSTFFPRIRGALQKKTWKCLGWGVAMLMSILGL